MENWLFLATSVFLFAGWLAMELSQHKVMLAGTVVGFKHSQNPMADMIALDVVVRLDNGSEVIACASGCARCQTRLVSGATVAVLKQKKGYVIAVPWLKRVRSTCRVGE